jgi:hypothetical protein
LPSSTSNVWLNPNGAQAAVGAGVCVFGGGGTVAFGDAALPLPLAPLTGITDGAGPQTVLINGG